MERKDKIKALRNALGLTQQQLADRAGLSRVDVSRIESGYNQATSWRVIDKLANGFGLAPDRLASILDDQSPFDESVVATVREQGRAGSAIERIAWEHAARNAEIDRINVEDLTRRAAEARERVRGRLLPSPPADLRAAYPNLAAAIDDLTRAARVSESSVAKAKSIAALFQRDLDYGVWCSILLGLEPQATSHSSELASK
ncbi:helix-turn-helix domain-containing protein [Sorangium cellulosum]|uniref:helix-turn-helix domain-containing protein n=1 Tax=Sorangium cellulosum TaxID=56 RepID=UPI0007795BB3|nr:helix-turn-helix domain-containing protein [Sorangium cellulosum]